LAIAQPSDPAFNIKATFAHGLSSKKKKKKRRRKKIAWSMEESAFYVSFPL
jgi:hypothetical protein